MANNNWFVVKGICTTLVWSNVQPICHWVEKSRPWPPDASKYLNISEKLLVESSECKIPMTVVATSLKIKRFDGYLQLVHQVNSGFLRNDIIWTRFDMFVKLSDGFLNNDFKNKRIRCVSTISLDCENVFACLLALLLNYDGICWIWCCTKCWKVVLSSIQRKEFIGTAKRDYVDSSVSLFRKCDDALVSKNIDGLVKVLDQKKVLGAYTKKYQRLSEFKNINHCVEMSFEDKDRFDSLNEYIFVEKSHPQFICRVDSCDFSSFLLSTEDKITKVYNFGSKPASSPDYLCCEGVCQTVYERLIFNFPPAKPPYVTRYLTMSSEISTKTIYLKLHHVNSVDEVVILKAQGRIHFGLPYMAHQLSHFWASNLSLIYDEVLSLASISEKSNISYDLRLTCVIMLGFDNHSEANALFLWAIPFSYRVQNPHYNSARPFEVVICSSLQELKTKLDKRTPQFLYYLGFLVQLQRFVGFFEEILSKTNLNSHLNLIGKDAAHPLTWFFFMPGFMFTKTILKLRLFELISHYDDEIKKWCGRHWKYRECECVYTGSDFLCRAVVHVYYDFEVFHDLIYSVGLQCSSRPADRDYTADIIGTCDEAQSIAYQVTELLALSIMKITSGAFKLIYKDSAMIIERHDCDNNLYYLLRNKGLDLNSFYCKIVKLGSKCSNICRLHMSNCHMVSTAHKLKFDAPILETSYVEYNLLVKTQFLSFLRFGSFKMTGEFNSINQHGGQSCNKIFNTSQESKKHSVELLKLSSWNLYKAECVDTVLTIPFEAGHLADGATPTSIILSMTTCLARSVPCSMKRLASLSMTILYTSCNMVRKLSGDIFILAIELLEFILEDKDAAKGGVLLQDPSHLSPFIFCKALGSSFPYSDCICNKLQNY